MLHTCFGRRVQIEEDSDSEEVQRGNRPLSWSGHRLSQVVIGCHRSYRCHKEVTYCFTTFHNPKLGEH